MQEMTRLYSGASPEQVAADLAPLLDFQDEGLPLDTLDELLHSCLVPHLMRYDRPEFQSMFNATLEEGAALGARLNLAYNQGVTNWQVSPGSATLEELCCQALCRLFGLAPTADATFMLAGTYANQQAVYMALHRQAEREGFDFSQEGLLGFPEPGRLVAVSSRDAHFSLKHAVRTMGLGERCLVTVDVDGDRRLDVACLEEALTSLSKTKDVFCVVATAGTTSTGSVDPLAPVARLCQDTGAWFHVDGAYGLAYSLVPEWGLLFAGVELADSVSWDPHKQFRVSIPNSVFFARRREDFRRMALFADYFNPEGEVAPNPGLKSIPSTRPLAALELVTSLRHQGLHKVRENLRAPLVAIRVLAEHIQEQADLELSHKPDTGILCFRATPPGFPEGQLDDLQSAIYERIVREGKRSISLTRLDGRAVLRLVAISPVVTAGAMIETMAVVQRLAREILMEA
jgi:glutamate/tyrosine decarboxylase-like PLP-dependent enzyme